MSPLFQKWLALGEKLSEQKKLECPSCGKTAIDFQYTGNPSTRIGYLDIWCKACLKGIHVSRVRIPENETMLDINALPIEATRIPNFTWILPDESDGNQ